MVRRTATAALGAAACIALVPGAAQAATKHVDMGPPQATAKKLQALGADAQAFFPSRITIRAGDSVEFMPNGFHNLDLPRRGGGPVPFAVPTGTKADARDAAGQPFWFNGQDTLGFNPALVRPKFGTTATYTGAKSLNSGLPLGPGRPKPFKVKFNRTGTFSFYCDLHPGMRGSVTVKGKRARVASAKSDRRRAARQAAQAVATAKKLASTKPAPTTVLVGAAGRGGVEVFGFFPQQKTVPVGTTIRFAMDQGSREVHTATTGPGDLSDERDTRLLNVLAKSFESPQFDPRATYPSEPPGTAPAALTPSLHGDGFWNTGAMDASNPTPLPGRGTVTFAQAGTYTFFCLIHPFMKGRVTAE